MCYSICRHIVGTVVVPDKRSVFSTGFKADHCSTPCAVPEVEAWMRRRPVRRFAVRCSCLSLHEVVVGRGFAGSGDDGSCGLRRGEAHGVSVEKWLYDGGW
ncbi:hypothetical protein KC363_g130 [Hortaea werneckii]|nr:hypothetical protein KC363_g130 [Hortaea werneckii]